MDLPTSLNRSAPRRYPDVLYHGEVSQGVVALTFDDGPHPRDTARVLEVLEKHQVRATFHLVGKSAERSPELVREIHRCGHQLALHCYRHVPFPLESSETLREALERTRKSIADATGVSPASIRDLRPPYGLFNARILSRLTRWGYRLVMWSCLPPHWMQPAGWSIRQVLESAVPGAVIVLHDGHGHGRKAAEILEAVIPQIKSLALDFVTVQEMWALQAECTEKETA